ncbi:MAG: hypothetical protein JW741_05505 [Sedimentisphaerales bacterium]|nr:hypothetical protein [Sedimentisphaerales bacterium]
MIVRVLFRPFGRSITAFIDQRLGLATVSFVILAVGGFLAVTLLEDGGEKAQDKCAAAVQIA